MREPDVVLRPVKTPSLVGETRSAHRYPYISKMYPTPDEAAVLETVEAFMVKIMAQYDPSHDALHGESKPKKIRAPGASSIISPFVGVAYSPTCPQDCIEAGL